MLEEDTILIQQPTKNIVINITPHYSNRIVRKCLGVRIIDHARPLACLSSVHSQQCLFGFFKGDFTRDSTVR